MRNSTRSTAVTVMLPLIATMTIIMTMITFADASTVLCSSDSDCKTTNEYCSHGVCRLHGTCLRDVDCINPSNDYITSETCAGHKTCNADGICQSNCGDRCPAGVQHVSCFQSECANKPCGDAVNCVDTFCGGCIANHFDAAGYGVQQCADLPDACASNSDCPGGYCASGRCLEMSTCKQPLDCWNPANEYSADDCVGPIDCVKEMCVRTCTQAECIDGTDFVACGDVNPCDALPCNSNDESAGCYNNFCDGCHAVHFNAVGEQICEDSSTMDKPISNNPRKYQDELKEMMEARSWWKSHAMQTYDFGFKRNCRCFLDFVAALGVSVTDNKIQSVNVRATGEPAANDVAAQVTTIDGLFDTIQDAINRQVGDLRVKYNKDYGYPTTIYIDEDTNKADDENEIVIGYLTPYTSIQTTSTQQQQTWQQSPSSNEYTYEFRRQCFCSDNNMVYKIHVVNDIIVSINDDNVNDVQISSNDNLPTINGLFQMIDDAIQSKAYYMNVRYDNDKGYPTRIEINQNELRTDDEFIYLSNLLDGKDDETNPTMSPPNGNENNDKSGASKVPMVFVLLFVIMVVTVLTEQTIN